MRIATNDAETGNYELKDRRDFVFPVITDEINCHSRIYNSKILSVHYEKEKIDCVRIDILHETEAEIADIISKVKSGKVLSGKNYTNGNG